MHTHTHTPTHAHTHSHTHTLTHARTHTHAHTRTHGRTQHIYVQENDRAFGVVSRVAKKTKVIGSTKAWMHLAKTAKQPNYHCIDMQRQMFRDWKKYLGAKYRIPSRWVNTDDENVPFMKVSHAISPYRHPKHAHEHHFLLPLILVKVRWFNYGVGEGADGTLESHPDEVWYRLSLDTSEAWKKISLNRRVSSVGMISDPVYDLYDAALPMTSEKIKDLSKFRKWYSHTSDPISILMDHLNNP
jgi:hypothetical protein